MKVWYCKVRTHEGVVLPNISCITSKLQLIALDFRNFDILADIRGQTNMQIKENEANTAMVIIPMKNVYKEYHIKQKHII